MKAELQRIEFLGKEKCTCIDMPLTAHFKVHTEQGPILEREGKQVAVVGGVQTMRRYKVICTGREVHAGAGPMYNRAEALLAAAKQIAQVNTLAISHGVVATVGIVKTATEAGNAIVGSAWFTVDLRGLHGEELDAIKLELKEGAKTLSSEGVGFSFEQIWDHPAVRFDKTALSCLRSVAEEYAGKSMCREMDSAVGHDRFPGFSRFT